MKTELVLPNTLPQRILVTTGIAVGGLLGLAMVALVSVFLFETVRTL